MKLAIKKERVFRALSLKDGRSVSEIARSTGLAKSYVSGIVKKLKESHCLWNGPNHLHIDQKKLIREWGDFKRSIFNKMKPVSVDVFFPEKIKEIGDYAVSGPFAEMLIQGESPGRPIVVYVKENMKMNRIKKLGKIGKGSTLVFFYDNDIFRSNLKIKGWNIVAVPQVCADLIALGTYADLGIELFNRWLDAGRRV